jgi:uncharacterized membrane protein
MIKEHKKGIIIGFIFGVLSVPIATLGLVSVFFEVVFRPIIFVPRLIVLSLMDPQNLPGLLTMGTLALVSGVFYALVGLVISYLYKQMKK